ncbi:MAG: hypothetical protein JXA96_09475 [Sedimentisphaerales bacterium]|nr:hypothetical protein [Sedimentisphaerales bacterium]
MSKDRIFQLIGKITVQFATMEHRLQGLLEKLMGDSNTLVGPMFIHDIPLAGLLKKIRFLARCRLKNDSNFFSDLERILKNIGTLRQERNLLIHGDWKIEDLETFRITVRDFKLKYEEGTWQEFTEIEFTEKNLRDLNRRLEGLGNEVDFLVRRLNENSKDLKTCNTPTSEK